MIWYRLPIDGSFICYPAAYRSGITCVSQLRDTNIKNCINIFWPAKLFSDVHVARYLKKVAHPCLTAILDASTTNPHVQRILTLLTTCSQDGPNVSFIRVPEHTGIGGNERVDQAAKLAMQIPRVNPKSIPTNADLTHFGMYYGKTFVTTTKLNNWNNYPPPGPPLTWKHVGKKS